MNYVSAGPFMDSAVLVSLVDPATTGPITRSSHSLSYIIDAATACPISESS